MRYGHLNFRSLTQLSEKEMVTGIPKIDIAEGSCETCLKEETRLPFSSDVPIRERSTLKVYSDICGPLEVPTLGGNKYFITFVDEFTRMTWLYLIKFKSGDLEQFKKFKAIVENQSGKRIKVLMTDGGGEYTS